MDKDIKLYVGATCLSPNEHGEVEFKADCVVNTKIQAYEIQYRCWQSKTM